MVGGGKNREEMRLIDADALLKELESSKLQPTKDTDGFIDGWCEGFNTVVGMIRNQPTAFDTEKVVEQLKEAEKDISSLGHYAVYADDAIKIVLKGGTTD